MIVFVYIEVWKLYSWIIFEEQIGLICILQNMPKDHSWFVLVVHKCKACFSTFKAVIWFIKPKSLRCKLDHVWHPINLFLERNSLLVAPLYQLFLITLLNDCSMRQSMIKAVDYLLQGYNYMSSLSTYASVTRLPFLVYISQVSPGFSKNLLNHHAQQKTWNDSSETQLCRYLLSILTRFRKLK